MRPLIPLVFFACAAWFLFGSRAVSLPIPPAAEVDPAALTVAPRRDILTDPPQIKIGAYEQRCEACHALFESKPEAVATLLQHEHIVLDHGLNNRCYNCHALENRDKLVLHDGSLIGFGQVLDLCAKCHGTTFRDWERGVHGKTLGSWDATSGEQRHLSCTECHDPHAPAFPPIPPLPGPHTLRMGHQDAEAPPPDPRNPLQRWVPNGNAGPQASEH